MLDSASQLIALSSFFIKLVLAFYCVFLEGCQLIIVSQASVFSVFPQLLDLPSEGLQACCRFLAIVGAVCQVLRKLLTFNFLFLEF
jgi:hypothetical protein